MSEADYNKLNVEFRSNISGFHPKAKKITICNTETEKFDNKVNVFAEDTGNSELMYNFDLRCEIPGTFFRGHTFLKSYILICIENYLYLYNFSTEESNMYKLQGYFDNFISGDDFVIISTDTHLMKINILGEVDWISEKIAAEKIAVKEITNGIIIGSGNWGQPKSWETFKLDLNTGKYIKEVKNKQSKGLKGFIKKVVGQAAIVLS